MRWIALIAVIALGYGGWTLYKKNLDPVSSDAKSRMALIKDGLDREIGATLVCVRSGPFPYDSNHRGLPCQRCEDLEAAGLLERKDAADTTEERPHWSWELTSKGEEVYTTEDDAVTGVKGPRFCFGRAKVHHLAAAQPALQTGGVMFIGVEYVFEAVDPHPLLSDPSLAPLGLPIPTGDNPKLFKPAITTLRFSADGQTYLESDPSMRYGGWMNR
jgi:hypothetical protein